MAKIFINYRREDSAGYAIGLYDRLVSHFGRDAIFRDIDQIEPGEDFVEVIQQKLVAVQVAVVLIGKHWLDSTDAAGQRRLDNPDDFVRLEIATLLERGIRVIPVLVGGATVPKSSQLPECLAPLARRNAYEISDLRFRTDVDKLIQVLEKAMGVQTQPPPPPVRPNPPEITGKPNSQRFMVILGAIAVLVAAFGLFHYSPWIAQENGKQLSQPVTPEPKESVARQSTVEQPAETSSIPVTQPSVEQPGEIELSSTEQAITEQPKKIKTSKQKYVLEQPVVLEQSTENIYFIEPEMVRISPGKFVMGSQTNTELGQNSNEGPLHTVTISQPFAISRYEITVGQFRQFVQDNSYHRGKAYLTTAEQSGRGCYGWNTEKKQFEQLLELNWKNPGFKQGDDHPVVCVSWDDAQAYVAWLSRRSGANYHLPTEAEWEYAARAGTQTAYWWGNDIGKNNDNANCYACGSEWDGRKTAPVGSFKANTFGLNDTAGNVWEWVEDCWHENYQGAPANGSMWEQVEGGDCDRRVARGGSWSSTPRLLRSAFRFRYDSDNAFNDLGFRIARAL